MDLTGPLAGVPIAVKDDIDLAGEVATRGSRSFGPPATADAEVDPSPARGRRDPRSASPMCPS